MSTAITSNGSQSSAEISFLSKGTISHQSIAEYSAFYSVALIATSVDMATLDDLTTSATMYTNISNNYSLATNATKSALPPHYSTWQAAIISTILAFLTCGTILGNVLVCQAVGMVKKLRTPSNLLIVSLAVSDLLVAVLVMPFAATYEVKGMWPLGQIFCDTWTSLDVMLCTASILNLCMISVDRYFVITRPFQYAVKRTPRRMAAMISVVWASSGLISIPPVFGWKSEWKPGECIVSQALGYQIYATIGAFYLPLAVMIFIYYRIYMVSSRIAKAEAKSQPAADPTQNTFSNPYSECSSRKESLEATARDNINAVNGSGEGTMDAMLPNKRDSNDNDKRRSSVLNRFQLFKKGGGIKLKGFAHRESKATKTLGVIMGGFTACWLPFFICALVKPLCNDSNTSPCIPNWVSSIFLWLGYANSFLNPIIYARFNRDFRTPFKEILLCRCAGINTRLRNEQYNEQYGGSGPSHLRDHIKPPVDTVVKYQSQGQTIVKVGNGSAFSEPSDRNGSENV